MNRTTRHEQTHGRGRPSPAVRTRAPRWIAAASAIAFGGCAADELSQDPPSGAATADAPVRVMRLSGRDGGAVGSAAPPAPVAPADAHLSYFGGKVIRNASVIQVLYGAGTYIPEITAPGGVNMASAYTQMLTSGIFDWLIEYNTSAPPQGIGRGSFLGSVQITPDPMRNFNTLLDRDFQVELAAQIAAGALPAPTNNTVYMVSVPRGKVINLNNELSCSSFCAYHGTFKIGTQNVYYGVLPDLAAPGCATGCGAAPTTFQNQQSVASHELIEAITDPEVGLAPTIGPPLAWYDPKHGEIGDICVGQQATYTGGDGQSYTIQKEFSNKAGDCIVTRAVPHALARLTGDVDGDGKTDIIEPFDNASGRLGMRVYRSTGTGYTQSFSSDDLGQGALAITWLTGDVNGDGKTDVIQLFDNHGRLGVLVYASNGTGYVNTFGTSDIGQSSAAITWLTGDVNGDGKTDIIQPWDNHGMLGLLVYTSNGTGYTNTFGTANIGQASAALAWLTGDVNGDGKTDIIQPWDNGGRSGFIVYGSTGTGYTTTFVTTNSGQGSGALAWLTGDVNGDGKTDVLQPWDSGGRSGLIVYTSDGVGYTATFGTSNTGQGSTALAWLTGDFNGDHRVDILQPWANTPELGLIVYASNGVGLDVGFATGSLGPLD